MFAHLFYDAYSKTGKYELVYNGKTVNYFYKITNAGEYKIDIDFISTNSTVEQAVDIHLSEFVGDIYVNGKKYKTTRRSFPQLILSEKDSPKSITLDIVLRDGYIGISNASEHDGRFVTLQMNCAMIFEQLAPNKIRCHCCDHTDTVDFDALVFDMTIEKLS